MSAWISDFKQDKKIVKKRFVKLDMRRVLWGITSIKRAPATAAATRIIPGDGDGKPNTS